VGGLSTFSFAFAQTRTPLPGGGSIIMPIAARFSEIDARLLAHVDMTIERRRFANVCEVIWQRDD
jgi:hypothetical protein